MSARPAPSRLAAAVLAVAALAGCQSIGPRTVSRDRTNYGTAITDSWKEQTLLNIVKLRYSDPPVFMDVGQIVSGYQFEAAGAVGLNFNSSVLGGDTQTNQAQGRYIDRPTITYVPLTGSRFINGLVTPISPTALFNAIAAGWPADVILYIGTHAINGLRNERSEEGGVVAPDPRFLRVTTLLRRLQVSGAISTRVEEATATKPATLVAIGARDISDEHRAEIAELRELLQLNTDASEFRLVYGAINSGPREIAVQTRSLLNVLASYSLHVDVPPEHIAEGRARSGIDSGPHSTREVHVQCTTTEPKDAFVRVRYRDHWFWIDDRDLVTKQAFALIMLLYTMSDTGGSGALPVLTIPTS